jgi:hypothetical protein
MVNDISSVTIHRLIPPALPEQRPQQPIEDPVLDHLPR